MFDPKEQAKAKNELTDMDIASVGLVPAGANNIKQWIILKNKGKEFTMAKGTTLASLPIESEANFLQRLWLELGNIFKPEASDEAAVEEAPVAPVAQAAPPPPPAEEPAPEAQEAMMKTLIETQAATLQKSFEVTLQKMEERVKVAEEIAKKAEARAEKAEQYADGQTDKVARQEALQKALSYKAMPLAPTDLGTMLYDLQKSLPAELYGKVESLLKAVDKQAWTAGLFSEFGSTRTAEQVALEDKLAKIAKEQKLSPAEALLSLPLEEQEQVLKQWEKEAPRG